MLAPEEEEVAALEWDVSEAAVVAAAAAIVNLAAVDPDMALLCGRTTDSLWRTCLRGRAGR